MSEPAFSLVYTQDSPRDLPSKVRLQQGSNVKQNWFNTLNESLESEGLLESWQLSYPGIGYGETFSYTWDDGTKYGHYVSIYRSEQGKYERAVHYQR